MTVESISRGIFKYHTPISDKVQNELNELLASSVEHSGDGEDDRITVEFVTQDSGGDSSASWFGNKAVPQHQKGGGQAIHDCSTQLRQQALRGYDGSWWIGHLGDCGCP